MSSDPVVGLERCSKLYLTEFNAGRRYLFARLFWGRREPAARWQSSVDYALKDVTLQVREGEKLNVVGGPGSGKTTLGYLLAGTLGPSSGTRTASGPVGYFGKLVDFTPPLMTVREFSRFSSFLSGHRGDVDPEAVRDILADPDVQPWASRLLRDVPTKVLTSVCLRLLAKSHVSTAVLDEPTDLVWDAFANRPDFGAVTIIALSRRPRAFLMPFDRLVVLSRGELLYDGAWQEGCRVYEKALEDFPPDDDARASGYRSDDDEEDESDEPESDGADEELAVDVPALGRVEPKAAPVPGAPGRNRARLRTARRRGDAEAINPFIQRTHGERRGHGLLQLEAVWTSPQPTAEEFAHRLSLVSGEPGAVYVWFRVVDRSLLGQPVRVLCRIWDTDPTESLLLSTAALDWEPTLDRDRECVELPIERVTLPAGEFHLRIALLTGKTVQDVASLRKAVIVRPGQDAEPQPSPTRQSEDQVERA